MSSSSDTGQAQGQLAIVSAEPDSSKPLMRYPGETLSLRVTVKAPASMKVNGSLSNIEAEVLLAALQPGDSISTWAIHKMEAEPLPTAVGSRSWKRPATAGTSDEMVSIVFFVMISFTELGKYLYKIRCRAVDVEGNAVTPYMYVGGSEDKEWKLRVSPVEPESRTWTSGPVAVEVHPNIYVGNFMAACDAQSLGFAAILNMAEELDVPVSKFSSPAPLYKKIGLLDGTVNPISLENILAAVRWLEAREGSKVLIHCRAGQGRSGSIAIAYKFKKFPLLTYDEVLQLIWKAKPDITPHKGLKQTLESIRWD